VLAIDVLPEPIHVEMGIDNAFCLLFGANGFGYITHVTERAPVSVPSRFRLGPTPQANRDE
jgi:hypothetical protein